MRFVVSPYGSIILTRYVEDQSIKAAQDDSARGRALGFTMAMLQRRFASSVFAVRRTLERMKLKREQILADPEAYRKEQINKKLPEDFDDLPENEQSEIIAQLEGIVASVDPIALMKRSAGSKRAQELFRVAGESIGRKTGLVAAEASLQNLLDEYELYSRQYVELEQLMLKLVKQVPHAEKLLEIKGVGLITAATFVGKVGDISRFQDPRQIQKLAGLNLVENSSGKHKGKTRISRRGRRRLRHGLFMSMITILATNPEFRMLHQKNLTREKNPLTKMQSIIALCGKLIRVFYGLLRTGRDYSAEKMLGDINQGMKKAA